MSFWNMDAEDLLTFGILFVAYSALWEIGKYIMHHLFLTWR